jgi:NDP-sugar pyrophosphorylase family protein
MKPSPLPVAILAGGLATRLRPLTEKIPKALVEVAGEPFIAHQLRLLHSRGIARVVVCAAYKGEMIREFVEDGRRFDLQVDFVFDGERFLGTGGAVKKALPFLGSCFFVLYGDSYLPCDYRAVQAAFEASGLRALMTVFGNRGLWDTSNVLFEEGRIMAYDKKNITSRMQHIDYGLGVFRAAAFDEISEEDFDLAELYQRLLGRGQLAAFEVKERFYEIGSHRGLEEARRFLASHDDTSSMDVAGS